MKLPRILPALLVASMAIVAAWAVTTTMRRACPATIPAPTP